MSNATAIRKTLAKAPRFLRSGIARGLASRPGTPPIDEKGGDNEAGIIRRMAVVTRGEALGHGMWIDVQFLSQSADAINATPKGVKARFTHPSLSSDGLGKYTGRVKDASVDGDVVRADLHLSELSRETPDGDLGGYLLKLASKDPEAFGNSIVFDHDVDAEAEFMLAHGAEWVDDPWYGRYLSLENFKSPDADNTGNLPHCRLKELRACDAVDDPAANPNGLFHRGDQIAADADALLSYGLGLTTDRPELAELDLDPERFAGFVKRFLDRHGLTTVSAQAPPTPAPALTSTPATGAQFLAAFGDQGGVWFAQGKTFAEATQLHAAEIAQKTAALEAENDKLKRQIAAHVGEATPLSASRQPDPAAEDLERMASKLGSEGLARFAAGNRIDRDTNK